MKNFTNNFKQFTSRLSARWLIMALMLLLGTSSAWADHIQNTGSMCLKYWSGSGSDIWTSAIDLGKTLNLGDISGTPYIKAAWVKTQGGTSINYLKIVIYIDGVYKGDYGVNYSGNSSYWDRTFEGSFDIAFNTTPGEHTIEIKAEPNNATHGSTYVKYNVPGAVDPCIPKFYLAGTFPGLSWTAGKSGGQEMVCNDGVHTKTYKNVTLEAKKYEYKVTGVNGWGDNEFPGSGNSEYTVESAGNYDVTFTYVPNTSLSVSLKSACSAPSSVSIDGVPSTNPCPGTEVTLEANVGEGDVESYSWSVTGTGWSIKENANKNASCIFIVGTGKGTISLKVNGCNTDVDASINIDVKSKPTKSDYTLQSSVEYGNGAPSITPKQGIPDPTTIKYGTTLANATTTAPTAVGTYNVYITTEATNTYCAVSDLDLGTYTITCSTPAAPNVTGTTNVVKCGDNVTTNGTITINNYENTSTYKLQLGNNAAQEVTPTNGVFSVSTNGTYKLTVTNSCGSSSTKSDISVGLTQNQVTISAISGSENICSESSESYLITAIDGVTYNWSINSDKFTLGDNGTNSIQVTATGTADATATLTVTATKSECPSTQTKSINLIALPTITTVSPTEGTVCSSTTISALEGTLSIDKSANSTTKWYKDGEEKYPTTTVETGKYTIKAVSNTGSCVSSTGVTYNVTGITTIPTGLTVDINGQSTASICGGKATINAKASGATSYSLYKGNGDLVETKDGNANGVSFTVSDANTYKVKATNNCGSTEFSSGVTLTVNPVPSFTKQPSYVTLCSSSTAISVNDLIAATGATASAEINLYDANGDEVTENININVTEQTTTTYKLKASTQTCSSDFVSFTLTVNPLPDAPALTSPAPVCEGTKVNLPTEGLKWYDAETGGTEVQNTAIEATGTYWAAAMQNGCESATRTEYTITVNPLPTITEISGNNSAVLYEDVELTATGVTQGAEVKWYLGNDETPVATGATYTVTSETAGEVIVKAKAILNGCESDEVSHTVTFSAENCTPVPSNEIEITFIHPANNQKLGQWWGMGKMYNSSGTELKNMGCSTSGSTTFTLTNVVSSSISVYFEACYDWGYDGDNTKKATTKNSKITLYKGKKYSITITNGNINATATATVTGSITNDPPIIAPAVKMVSAEYDEVNDKIVAKGAVYKTGCGETFWGFQYSADGQTWGTTDADFIRPSSGNSLSEPGVFAHSFEIPNANGGDIYYIRAYAINNYNKDNYSLNSAVFSETKIPVEIPSSTIESATISLVDSEGNPSTNSKVCPQSTVYLKVSYVGGDYKEFEATENFPGTNLVEVTRNKLDNYAIFSFTATSAGTANITISNNNSSVIPATGVAITLNDVETITTPVISMDPASGMICSDGEATITIYEPNANYTYALYKDSELADDESKGSYTVNEAGSYTVVATESVCGTSASSMAIELKVVSSDVKINLVADPTTTSPWQPIKLTVTPPAGYDYTLEGINDVEYTQNGDVYTVKIPRPETWPAGNSGTGKDLKTADKTFTANIKVSDTTSCGHKSVTVTLTDTEENCQ